MNAKKNQFLWPYLVLFMLAMAGFSSSAWSKYEWRKDDSGKIHCFSHGGTFKNKDPHIVPASKEKKCDKEDIRYSWLIKENESQLTCHKISIVNNIVFDQVSEAKCHLTRPHTAEVVQLESHIRKLEEDYANKEKGPYYVDAFLFLNRDVLKKYFKTSYENLSGNVLSRKNFFEKVYLGLKKHNKMDEPAINQFVASVLDNWYSDNPGHMVQEVNNKAEAHFINGKAFVEMKEFLGQGTQKEVFKAMDFDGKDVVFNRIKEKKENVLLESYILGKFGPEDKGVVKTLAITENFIVQEFFDVGDLFTVIDKRGLTSEESVELAHDIIKGISTAHGHGIVHRDIKPENILVKRNGNKLKAAVTDFGLSYIENDEKTQNCSIQCSGSLYYCSPNYLVHYRKDIKRAIDPFKALNHELNRANDVWSYGVTLYMMATRKYPEWVHHDNLYDILQGLSQAEVDKTIKAHVPPSHPLLPIIEKCLKIKLSERAKVKEILEFFN